jgi:Fe-S-cluster containining protein
MALCPPGEALTGCPFVMSAGDEVWCGIYSFRPRTCRVYPYTRTARQPGLKPDALCPPGFQPGGNNCAQMQAEIDQYQAEWDHHSYFCRQWNDDPPKYPSFEKLADYVEGLIITGQV